MMEREMVQVRGDATSAWAGRGLVAVLILHPLLIRGMFFLDVAPPGFVVFVPIDGEADIFIESVLWLPSEFFGDFGRVDRVARNMAGTVVDVFDERFGFSGCRRIFHIRMKR